MRDGEWIKGKWVEKPAMTELSEREKLIIQLIDVSSHYEPGMSENYGRIADFILADRKRVVEELLPKVFSEVFAKAVNEGISGITTEGEKP